MAQGLVPEKKVFEVHIEQGHKHASKIVLRGEAGRSEPNVEPGDVIFVLEQKQHKDFRRIHSDLVYEKVRPSNQACALLTALTMHCRGKVARARMCMQHEPLDSFQRLNSMPRSHCQSYWLMALTLSAGATLRCRRSPWPRRCAAPPSPSSTWTTGCWR